MPKVGLNVSKVNTIIVDYFYSPMGKLLVGSFGDKLCLCDWVCSKKRNLNDQRILRFFDAVYKTGNSEIIDLAISELREFFTRKRTVFDIPIAFSGTEFQNAVWREIFKVQYAKTITYRDLASRVGNDKAFRAVAQAVGANPISIIVPCHRVVGASLKMTGYAGGIDAKIRLLDFEKDDSLFTYP